MARLQGDYVFGAFVLAGILGVVSVPVGGFLVGLLGLDIGSWVAYPLCFGTFAIVIAVMLVVRMRAPEPPPVPGAPPPRPPRPPPRRAPPAARPFRPPTTTGGACGARPTARRLRRRLRRGVRRQPPASTRRADPPSPS